MPLGLCRHGLSRMPQKTAARCQGWYAVDWSPGEELGSLGERSQDRVKGWPEETQLGSTWASP